MKNKQEYQTPEIIEYGDLVELTQGDAPDPMCHSHLSS